MRKSTWERNDPLNFENIRVEPQEHKLSETDLTTAGEHLIE